MKTWIRPMVVEECFVSNENIANRLLLVIELLVL